QAKVLPVAELFHAVDILVGQVDAARESDLAVDNHHFAVVAAVERALQKQKRVERRAADALLLQLPGVAAVVGRNAAKVVVQNADVDARSGLAAQNLDERIPQNAAVDDKIFNKDEALRLFQRLQHHGVDIVAQRVEAGERVGLQR